MEEIEIRTRQQIDPDWSEWLGGMTVAHPEDGGTLLTGCVRDQSALRGLIIRVIDLGLELSLVVSRRLGPVEEVLRM